ncbi:hypothetical protein GF318_05475 [Candidatus Micrarchaeota archaeon]|nr:hypothetical protein [Candidatus Micrarchaeota archaeon]
MGLNFEKFLFYGLPVWTLLILFILTPGSSPYAINRVFALASVAVVGITFIIGPLGKFSKTANRLKVYRKYLGISAFVLMLAHGALSAVYIFDMDFVYMFLENSRTLQFYSALFAFLIFFLMTITSTQKAITLLGPRNWKMLQTSGYVAMALGMLHFMLANTNGGFSIGRIYAMLIFVFGLVAVAFRVLVFLLVAYEKLSRKK